MKKAKFSLITFLIISTWVVIFLSGVGCTSLFSEEVPKETKRENRNTWLLIPKFFYTPETKIGTGGAGMAFFPTSKNNPRIRPSNILVHFTYTQMKQYEIEIRPDIYLSSEKYHLTGSISLKKFPSMFHGIGSSTLNRMGEGFTPRTLNLKMALQRKIWSELALGLEYVYTQNSIIKVEEDGSLAKGNIVGSRGGKSSGMGLVLTWESRNNIFYPSSGSFYQLSTTLFSHAWGSDYNFNRLVIDGRRYFSPLSSHVLALQGYLSLQSGVPPFDKLSKLGGESIMRGYYQGRYRDKNMFILQMEYRIVPVFWRLGLVGFAGIGDVADRMDHFDFGHFKYSYGFGIRFLFKREERLNLRIDFAFGKKSSGFYIVLGEAF